LFGGISTVLFGFNITKRLYNFSTLLHHVHEAAIGVVNKPYIILEHKSRSCIPYVVHTV